MGIIIGVVLLILCFVYRDPLYDFKENSEEELSAFLEENENFEVYIPYDIENFSDFFDKRPE